MVLWSFRSVCVCVSRLRSGLSCLCGVPEAIDDRVLHLLRCAVDGRARLEDRRDLSIGRALDRARIEETPKGRLPLLGADATDEEEKDGAGGDRTQIALRVVVAECALVHLLDEQH